MTLIISPHFDDAVFSCGAMIASDDNATILTVMADSELKASDKPYEYSIFQDDAALVNGSPWNQVCGFTNDREAIIARGQEDQNACGILGCNYVWKEFLDSGHEYRMDPTPYKIAKAIAEDVGIALSNNEKIYAPLGISHPDHIAVREAAMMLMDKDNYESFIFYGDSPYWTVGSFLAVALGQVIGSESFIGYRLTSHLRDLTEIQTVAPLPDWLDKKTAAIACYKSQVPNLQAERFGANVDLAFSQAERYWRVNA